MDTHYRAVSHPGHACSENNNRQTKNKENDNKQNKLTNKKRREIPPIIRHCWGEPISHRSSWNWAIYRELSNSPPQFPIRAQLLRRSPRSTATLAWPTACVAGWSSRSVFLITFLFVFIQTWQILERDLFFSFSGNWRFKKVTRNEHFVEQLWNLSSLGPRHDPADILYRNQRWRIKISTCGDWLSSGGWWRLSLGQELLEEALLLGLGTGGPSRALLGPDGPWLVKVGVTAHQVYCALDISEHLNLLYLKKNIHINKEINTFIQKGSIQLITSVMKDIINTSVSNKCCPFEICIVLLISAYHFSTQNIKQKFSSSIMKWSVAGAPD